MPGIADQIRELVRSVTNLARRIRRLETLPNSLAVARPQGGHIIQDEGSSLPDQVYLDFIGVGVTTEDNPENGKTTVTIPGTIQEVINVINGAVLDKINLIHADGGGVVVYDPTEAGLSSALANTITGDVIYVPPATINGDHTIPADIAVWGIGKKSIFSGKITLLSGSILKSVDVIRSVNSGDDISGIVGPSSGTAYLIDCNVSVTNSGAGDAYAVLADYGDLWIWNCYLIGTASGAGDGYAVKGGGGECFIEGGYVRGSTDEFDFGYAVGSTISTTVLTVTAEAGHTVVGLIVGNWYCMESTGGPWNEGLGSTRYDIALSDDGGANWYGGPPPTGFLAYWDLPGGTHFRGFWKATTTSVKVRVDDTAGDFADNTGSLSAILKNASLTPIVHAVRSGEDGVPVIGDRGAWDVDDYDTLHASDINADTLLRHLPSPVGEADGNITYVDTEEWLVGTAEDAGLAVAPAPTDPYWEPAVVDAGEEIMFTDDGDIAMIWVGG